jgi:signal transduction histidine kinase/DNA-binding LacI/PurR family transcriptional regulator/ActR/RegA family two-component response regulator
MHPKPFAIGVFTLAMSTDYYGAMLNGIHQATRAAGVPLLIIQSEEDLLFPTFGAEYVAGWIVLHPMEGDRANLAALVASGVPVVTVATALDDVACTSVVADNRGDTRALVHHLIDHGHRQIAYIDHGPDSWSRERYQGYLDALQERGIALDPTLIINAFDTAYMNSDIDAPLRHKHCGEVTARELIARGMPCTALVAGTDLSAIGAMQVLQAASYRVPEDVAVVGFDDSADAQYTQPPLATVRTRFDQLGRMAAEELLALLRGEHDAQPRRIYAPTSMLRRRSCGCVGLTEIQARGRQAVAAAIDWQASLAQQLVEVICYPLARDLDTPPAQIWPGVGTLIAALDAVLQGQQSAPFAADIDVAWQQAVALTDNPELLSATVALLEDAAEQHLAAAPAARPAITALLREFRMAMLRARLGYEAAKNQYLTQSSRTHQIISLTLLSSQVGESQTLAWLHKTPASWGCLGRWDDGPLAPSGMLNVAGLYQPDSPPVITIGNRYCATAFPPIDALPLSAQQGQDLTILLPLCAGTENLGVLALCGFADRNFRFDTDPLWIQAGLLAATLKRDAQARQLAQARDAAEATNVALAQARDAAEAANAAKSAFLAQMSHELRTPLNGILGYAQILKHKRLDADMTSGLTIIQQSGAHLLTLINDILDLAKIEAGRLELAPTAVRLPSFLDSIVGIIRARAEAKQLSVAFEMPPSLPKWVQADETRLRQILLNLLGNAVKFTDRGQVALSVRTEGRGLRTESSNDLLSPQSSVLITFAVEDTGVGIAPDQLERIFQPFEQVGEQSRQVEGTGLGLAISRQLVRLMGGDLHVESQSGRGSTFWFALALPLAEAPGTATTAQERPMAGYRGARRTILVVDDIAVNRTVLTDMLQPLGFTVLEAQDGRQAIELAQQAHPDLIMMDRYMPVLSGVEAVRQIRTRPELGAIPIIATSASVAAADQAQSREAGYNAFLPKPIVWLRLAALLEQYLELDWVYADETEAAEVPAALIPPPQEELAELGELMAIGDILALQERAAQLEQRDPQWRAFARELARLAGQFELEQLRALLNKYLPTEPSSG